MPIEYKPEQSRLDFLRDGIRLIEQLEKELNAELLYNAEIQLQFKPKQRGKLRDHTVQALAAAYTLDDYLAAELTEEHKRLEREQ